MPSQSQNGRNASMPDDNRSSWSPHDQQARGRSEREREDRDDDRDRSRGGWTLRDSRMGTHRDDDRDEGYRTAERYGQGQSGYAAGRYGEDRSMNIQGRNQGAGSPGSFEDRQHGLGSDDRWSGRGGQGYWQDRGERERQERSVGMRGSEDPRTDERSAWGGAQPMGYQSGYGGSQTNTGRMQSYGQSGQGQGYGQSSQGYGQQGGRSFDQNRPSFRGKGPQGYQRSDDRIREQVCEVLTDDDLLDASMIEVVVTNGEVLLSGTVDQRNAKRHAEDIVERVPGVKDVQNQLKVQSDKGQQGKGLAGETKGDGGRSTSSMSSSSAKQDSESDRKHRA